MCTNSFENFLTDILVRSIESHDWISEEMENLDFQVEKDLKDISKSQIRALRNIYDSMVLRLTKNVKLPYDGSLLTPESIKYHKRFGWVLEAMPNGVAPNEIKIFLGKLSLLEDTNIVMGRRSYISGSSVIRGGEELRIGSYCSLAELLYINTFRDFHPMTHASTVNLGGNRRILEDGLEMPIHYTEFDNVKNGVIIGNDVWIGRRVRISHGVTIGDGCVIAENSLVRNDCESYGIYGGTPAKLIRYRFDQHIREQLLQIRWWEWPMEKIQRNKKFFGEKLTECNTLLENLID